MENLKQNILDCVPKSILDAFLQYITNKGHGAFIIAYTNAMTGQIDIEKWGAPEYALEAVDAKLWEYVQGMTQAKMIEMSHLNMPEDYLELGLDEEDENDYDEGDEDGEDLT